MDGFEVMPMSVASELGDVFITATGGKNVISRDHFSKMKDGAILANAGHFNVEVAASVLKPLRRNGEKCGQITSGIRCPTEIESIFLQRVDSSISLRRKGIPARSWI